MTSADAEDDVSADMDGKVGVDVKTPASTLASASASTSTSTSTSISTSSTPTPTPDNDIPIPPYVSSIPEPVVSAYSSLNDYLVAVGDKYDRDSFAEYQHKQTYLLVGIGRTNKQFQLWNQQIQEENQHKHFWQSKKPLYQLLNPDNYRSNSDMIGHMHHDMRRHMIEQATMQYKHHYQHQHE